jgi:hypothetical protein
LGQLVDLGGDLGAEQPPASPEKYQDRQDDGRQRPSRRKRRAPGQPVGRSAKEDRQENGAEREKKHVDDLPGQQGERHHEDGDEKDRNEAAQGGWSCAAGHVFRTLESSGRAPSELGVSAGLFPYHRLATYRHGLCFRLPRPKSANLPQMSV